MSVVQEVKQRLGDILESGDSSFTRNDLLAYLYASTHKNAYQELSKKWKDADREKGESDKLYDVSSQKEPWLKLHDHITGDYPDISSWAAVYTIKTDEGDTVIIGEYNNNGWGVTDVLSKKLSCEKYLSSWDDPPEEFSF